MSIKVKMRLQVAGRYVVARSPEHHDLRVQLDRLIEEVTGLPCDKGVDMISNGQLLVLLEEAGRRLRRKTMAVAIAGVA